MTRSLDGRRIIVTGGASGMGAGMVAGFSERGAQVVSMDWSQEAGQRVADEARATGFIEVDVSDSAAVEAAFERAVKMLGGLDVLVHAAGIVRNSPAEDIPLDQWLQIMAVNATSTFLTNKAAFPHLKDKGGAILNFASAAGVTGLPNRAAYAASKGAVVAWTRTVAMEWGKYPITVNAVAPTIRTPMYERTRSLMTPEALADHDRKMAERFPIGDGLGDLKKDFLPVMCFLASEDAHYLTGQVFAIDGGAVMMR
jgi:NAD(P)-dependent dehydrogenase (short-subunit alcohol dehydrogenase family)